MKKLKLYIAPIIDLNGLFDFMFKGIWFSVALIKRNFNAKEEMQITKKNMEKHTSKLYYKLTSTQTNF